MKIVLFDYILQLDQPGLSGLSDHVWDWATHLVTLGEEVHIVGPYLEHTQPPAGTILHRFPLPPIGYRNILGHLLIVLRGWLEIQKIPDVDIIHAPEYFSTGIFTLFAKEQAVVATTPGNVYERVVNGNPYDWSATLGFMIGATLSATRCTRIIATSRDLKQWWVRTGAHPDKVAIIPHGINVSRFVYQPDARERLGLDPNVPIILYVGRLSPEKGVLHLIQAVDKLQETHPSVQLHIVGDGKQKLELKEVAKSLGVESSIIWHGWLPSRQLPSFYSAADVSVVPSLSEPLARVILEGMSCSCVVLGSRVGGTVDLIEDSETGFLFEAGDVEQLKDTLGFILSNKDIAHAVGKRAGEHIRQYLSLERSAQRMYDEVYSLIAS